MKMCSFAVRNNFRAYNIVVEDLLLSLVLRTKIWNLVWPSTRYLVLCRDRACYKMLRRARPTVG